jgi:hypothetical protein
MESSACVIDEHGTYQTDNIMSGATADNQTLRQAKVKKKTHNKHICTAQ